MILPRNPEQLRRPSRPAWESRWKSQPAAISLNLALNPDDTAGPEEAIQMPKRTSASIARKAFDRADADFSTWLMMAKLGGFDDLPAGAQAWLMNYRGRLENMPEMEATSATVREVYAAYYAEMGGEGEPPRLAPSPRPTNGKVVDLKTARQVRTSRVTSAPAPERPRRTLSPFLIFAGMVALLAAIKFAFGF